MTIATETSRSGPYAGAGSPGPFTVGFRFLDQSHLQVVKTSVSGVDSTLTLSTNYTVSGAGNPTGSVTLTANLLAGEKLTIVRKVPFTQEADYLANDTFPAESHEAALDKLTQQAQQLKETVSRAIVLGVGSAASPVLPSDLSRANNLLGFDALGNVITVAPVSGSAADVLTQLADIVDPTTKGSWLITWIQAGIGAIYRRVRDKLRENVSVKDFGAVGDGTTNDTAAFLAACTSLGTKGGIVRYYDKHLIDGSFTVPKNVTIKGPMVLVGTPGDNLTTPYGNMAALIINPAATITLSPGSGHDGGLIYRKGMTFPAANSAAYAGFAFTAAGDDTFLINSMVIGFSKAFYLFNYQRPRIFNNWFDNIGGIEVSTCYDIAHVHDNHAWPFGTIGAYSAGGGVDKPIIQRSGTAFLFQDVGDWNKCTNNFSYGYARGTEVVNCNSMTILSCSHDNTPGAFAGSIGIYIRGTSNDTRIIGGQGAAQEVGILINTTAGMHTSIVSSNTWVSSQHGVLVDGGDVTIIGGCYRDSPAGITVSNAASKVSIDGVRFNNTTIPIQATVSTTKIKVGQNDYGNLASGTAPVNSSIATPSLASAATLSLPANDVPFVITGTTNIGSMAGGYSSRVVTLKFDSALTLLHTISAGGLRLAGSVNCSVVTGSVVTFEFFGNQWFEKSRAI